MRAEEYQKQLEEEQFNREQGIRRVLEFLSRTIDEDALNNPALVSEKLKQVNFEEFKGILTRLNGLLSNIPIEQRTILTKNSVLMQGGYDDWIDLKPPRLETRNEIFQEAFEKIKDLASSDHSAGQQALARTLFNSIIYLHIFPDGNGRTARLSYFVTSPRITKHPEEINQQLTQALTKRSPEIGAYHFKLDQGIYQLMLEERGIPLDFDPKEHSLYAYLKHEDQAGFDDWSLGYIAAYDTMTSEQRIQYGHRNEGSHVLSFVNKELPEELRKKIASTHDKVRAEFVRKIINLSADTEHEWPDFLQEPLDEAFEYKKVS